jgi:hypothetical protein
MRIPNLRRPDNGAIAHGAILWSGISPIDNRTPIVCVVTGLNRAQSSDNSKTGAMLQTWILVDPRITGLLPLDAVADGSDVAICGACPHRGTHELRKIGKRFVSVVVGRSCYVNLGQGPRSVAVALLNNAYPDVSNDLPTIARIGSGAKVRLGAYGDPAAVPANVWRALLSESTGHTGYTHQWRSNRLASALRDIVQASCDSLADRVLARMKGWGTFTVTARGEALPSGAILCPASEEAGKVTTCAECRMCDGSGRDIAIPAHGSGAVHVDRRRMLPVLA